MPLVSHLLMTFFWWSGVWKALIARGGLRTPWVKHCSKYKGLTKNKSMIVFYGQTNIFSEQCLAFFFSKTSLQILGLYGGCCKRISKPCFCTNSQMWVFQVFHNIQNQFWEFKYFIIHYKPEKRLGNPSFIHPGTSENNQKKKITVVEIWSFFFLKKSCILFSPLSISKCMFQNHNVLCFGLDLRH